MSCKAVWIGHTVRLELIHVILLVYTANHCTTQGGSHLSLSLSLYLSIYLSLSLSIYIYLYIYIYIYICVCVCVWSSSSSSCRAASTDIFDPLSPLLPIIHRYLAGLQSYIPHPHIASICMIELVVLLLLGHMRGSIGVHLLWARPCFSSSVLHVWLV